VRYKPILRGSCECEELVDETFTGSDRVESWIAKFFESLRDAAKSVLAG